MPLSPTVCRWRNIILISFDVIVKKGYRGIEPLKYYPNKPFIDLSLYHPYFFNIATTGIAKKYNSPVIVTIIDLDFHLDSLSRHSLLELLSLFIHYCLNVRFPPCFMVIARIFIILPIYCNHKIADLMIFQHGRGDTFGCKCLIKSPLSIFNYHCAVRMD